MPISKSELQDLLRVLCRPSGSLDVWTVSRNAHGTFIRPRVIPANPATTPQFLARRRFRNTARAWRTLLTAAQRRTWNVYAAGVPRRDHTGQTRHLTGFQHFMRSNFCRIQYALGIVYTAPIPQNVSEYSYMPSVFETPPSRWRLTWDTSDDFAGESGAYILCYRTEELPSTVNSFRPPYLHRYTVPATVTPPVDLPPPTLPTVGNHFFTKFQITRADGRLSYPQRELKVVRSAA